MLTWTLRVVRLRPDPTRRRLYLNMGWRARIVKVDVDEARDLATRSGIRAIPTTIIFARGDEVARPSGVLPKNELVTMIERHTE